MTANDETRWAPSASHGMHAPMRQIAFSAIRTGVLVAPRDAADPRPPAGDPGGPGGRFVDGLHDVSAPGGSGRLGGTRLRWSSCRPAGSVGERPSGHRTPSLGGDGVLSCPVHVTEARPIRSALGRRRGCRRYLRRRLDRSVTRRSVLRSSVLDAERLACSGRLRVPMSAATPASVGGRHCRAFRSSSAIVRASRLEIRRRRWDVPSSVRAFRIDGPRISRPSHAVEATDVPAQLRVDVAAANEGCDLRPMTAISPADTTSRSAGLDGIA